MNGIGARFWQGVIRLTEYWIGSRAWDRILMSCFI